MQTKQALKVLGTLIFLYGVFGYIFPHWGNVIFHNNENLFHVILGGVALFGSNLSSVKRRWILLGLALLLIGIGIYGLTLAAPTDFRLKTVTMQLDSVDNYIHALFGLAFAWFWLSHKKS